MKITKRVTKEVGEVKHTINMSIEMELSWPDFQKRYMEQFALDWADDRAEKVDDDEQT